MPLINTEILHEICRLYAKEIITKYSLKIQIKSNYDIDLWPVTQILKNLIFFQTPMRFRKDIVLAYNVYVTFIFDPSAHNSSTKKLGIKRSRNKTY